MEIENERLNELTTKQVLSLQSESIFQPGWSFSVITIHSDTIAIHSGVIYYMCHTHFLFQESMATRKLNLLAVSLVPLLVLFLTVSPNAVAGQPDINPDNYTCSRNISSLQELQPIGNSDEDFTMCISISADTHTINYTSTPIAYSVVMMGNNATIRCRPEVPLSNSDYNTFIFQSSRMVRLENVHFRDCLRPVLIREVLSVQLVNATFRSAILYVQVIHCIYLVPFIRDNA